jgi:short chain dehydrogenase
MRLEDKVAIVTGAAHGMGEAEARLFAQEGAKVVVADVLGEQSEAVAADIRAAGGEAIAATIDVTSEPAWVALIEKTVARYGQLDILVNNAGISGSSVGDPDGLEGGAACGDGACSASGNSSGDRGRSRAARKPELPPAFALRRYGRGASAASARKGSPSMSEVLKPGQTRSAIRNLRHGGTARWPYR